MAGPSSSDTGNFDIMDALASAPMDSESVDVTLKQSRNAKQLRLFDKSTRYSPLAIPTPLVATALNWQTDADGCLVSGEKPSWPNTPAPWDEPNLPLRPATAVAMPLLPDPDRNGWTASQVPDADAHRKTISKAHISSPTLISSSFSRSMVNLPQGASLRNGMEPYRRLGYRATPESLFQRSPGFKRQASWPPSSNRETDDLSHALANNMRKESRFTGFNSWFAQPIDSERLGEGEEHLWAPTQEVKRSKRSVRQVIFGRNAKDERQNKLATLESSIYGYSNKSPADWIPTYNVKTDRTFPDNQRSIRYLWNERRWLRGVRKPKTYVEDVLEHRNSPDLARQ